MLKPVVALMLCLVPSSAASAETIKAVEAWTDGCTMMGPSAANPRTGALLVGLSFIVLGLLLLLFVLRRGDVEE
jgi:hypothetical protein